MAHDADEELNRIAEALSDGAPIDWERVAADHPELEAELEGLRLFSRIADAHKTAVHAALGSSAVAGTPRAGGTPQAGAAPQTPSAAEVRPVELFTWGHLRVLGKIGEGSYGTVWRAWDPELHLEVALKLLHDDPAEGRLDRRAFMEEARRMARVRHPNVVVIHGAGEHDGRTGFWADLVRGQTLEERLAGSGTLAPGEAALIGLEVCRALAAVHAAGLVHGDVNARNVMRDTRGGILLTDFGAARERDAGRAGARVFGTPLATAPEVLDGGPAGPSCDLYALGVLMYRLVSGRYPVAANDLVELAEKHRRGDRVPLRDARPDLPAEFVGLVERSLSPDPSERFRSAGEMEAALRAFLASTNPARIRERPPGRRWWVAAALGVLAIAIILIALDRHPRSGAGTGGGNQIAERIADQPPADRPAAANTPDATRATPANAPEAATRAPSGAVIPALTGEATLYRSHGGSREALAPGGLVRPGDALFLELRVSQPAHVYVLNEDAEGAVVPLFPLPGLDLENPLAARAWHRLPGSRGGTAHDWQMSGGPGREGFLVIVSREPIPDLAIPDLAESVQRIAPGPQEPGSAPPAQEPRPEGSATRGISGVVPVDPAGQGDPGSRLATLMRALLDRTADPRGLWMRHFVLFNTGR